MLKYLISPQTTHWALQKEWLSNLKKIGECALLDLRYILHCTIFTPWYF